MRKKGSSVVGPEKASAEMGVENCGEGAAGVCVLCICCPLALLWCCVKTPCKLGWWAARRLAGGCGRRRSGYGALDASSSCSDVEFEVLPCKGRRRQR